jgi:hypothetical protein
MKKKNAKQWAGYHYASGVVKYLVELCLSYFVIVLLVVLASNTFSLGVDDTDKSGWKRSNMRLLTDHGTGIQYLSDGHGGMVRRYTE